MKQKSPIEELFAPDDAVEAPAPAVVPPPATPRLITLDCGHTNWFTEGEQQTARAEGFCCEGGRKNQPVAWDRLRGKYVRPLPVALRVTWERAHDTSRWRGFPGYCCDDAGYYIGGLANDCRYYRPEGASVCPAHRAEPPPFVSSVPEAEEADEEEDSTVTDFVAGSPPTVTPRKMTHKERQIELRKRKGR